MAKIISNWAEIKKAYLESGDSLAAIAIKFGVSKRTLERRASEEKWAAIRAAQTSSLAAVSRETIENVQKRQRIDLVCDIEQAITKLSCAIQETEPRSLEGCASALGKLVELHTKIVPQTASELAARAVELGIKPQDFIKALKEQWQDSDQRMQA